MGLSLCKRHFLARAFTNDSQSKLNSNAVPIHYDQMNVIENNNVEIHQAAGAVERGYIPDDGAIEINENQSNEINGTAKMLLEMEKLKEENLRLRESDLRWRESNKRLREENDKSQTRQEELTRKIQKLMYDRRQEPSRIAKAKEKMTIDEFLASRADPLDPVAETIVKLQFHQPPAPYTNEEQDFAKHFYFHSASTYSRLRESGLVLPAESTVRRWVSELNFTPGFCPDVFSKIKQKMAGFTPLQRMCCLVWDEMAIKNFVEYSPKYDIIEGLCDLGPQRRSNEVASQIFFFYLSSIDVEMIWDQPLGYFLVNKSGMEAEDISCLLKECLQHLKAADVDVKVLGCDQGNQNRRLYNQILQVNIKDPKVNIGGQDYFVLYDFPHLIKRVVYHLRKGLLYDDEGNVIANWGDFQGAYCYDKTLSTSNLLSHITPVHMDPNSWETMKVKLAFQIFGNRFAQAIKIWGESGEQEAELRGHPQMMEEETMNCPSKTWQQSANFAEKLNTIIDSCNSEGHFATNPNRRPLCNENPQVEENIKDLIQWSAKWRIHEKTKNKSSNSNKSKGKSESVTVKIPPCFEGLQLTGHAMLALYREIKIKYPNFKLCTHRLDSDRLEHFFGKIRTRNRNCLNPTASQVRLTVRHILSTKFIQTGYRGNVACEETNFLITPDASQISRKLLPLTESAEPQHNDCTDNSDGFGIDRSFIEEHDARENIQESLTESTASTTKSLYERNAITYYAGYVAFKCVSKSKCQDCRSEMMKSPMDSTTSNERYLELREYENPDPDAPSITKLTRPTDRFVKIVEVQLNGFSRFCEIHWTSTGILQNIARDIIKSMAISGEQWFNKHHPCYAHRIAALHFLLKIKLYFRAKFDNYERKAQKKPSLLKWNQKYKNLTHQ